jgi:hypothetical protein
MHNDFPVVTYQGKEYQLRASFKVAVGIQSRTNKTLAQAIFAAKSLSIVDIHAIACEGLRSAGAIVDDDAVGQLIIDDYATSEMKFINQVIAFGLTFFPKVENDGTKKQTATEVIG